MKFIKRSSIVKNNPNSDRFAVTPDDRIITDTKVALELPRGDNTKRPGAYVDGQIRYNTVLQEIEVYNSAPGALGWEKVRTVRPAPITVQTLGPGNYAVFDFGPLQYSNGDFYTDIIRPQNILVFVENVYQIPNSNYELVDISGRVYIRFLNEAPPSKLITVLLGFDGYFPPFPVP